MLYSWSVITDQTLMYFGLTTGSLAAIWVMSGLGACDQPRDPFRSRCVWLGTFVTASVCLSVCLCLVREGVCERGSVCVCA
jgi:hypothetical protein